MKESFTKQINEYTYISVDQGTKNGDVGCKSTIKIIDGKFYVQNVEYFEGECK